MNQSVIGYLDGDESEIFMRDDETEEEFKVRISKDYNIVWFSLPKDAVRYFELERIDFRTPEEEKEFYALEEILLQRCEEENAIFE